MGDRKNTMTIEEQLEDLGLNEEQLAGVVAAYDAEAQQRGLRFAAELLHRILLRVDRDSVAGRALARAMGATNEDSLERAAAAFGVSKQYLHRLQSEIEAKLRDMGATAPRGNG